MEPGHKFYTRRLILARRGSELKAKARPDSDATKIVRLPIPAMFRTRKCEAAVLLLGKRIPKK